MKDVDVAIIGGGPAGLAAALATARRGLKVVLLEKRRWPLDKACGEGIMPVGLAILRRLGIQVEGQPFMGIHYRLADGSAEAQCNFAEGPGLGVRRLQLSQALVQACQEQAGILLRSDSPAEVEANDPDGVVVKSGGESWRARLLLGADGLHSRVRRFAGLEGGKRWFWRWGARQHFWVAPWTDKVEVTLADGCEAYVTPVSPDQVGVAILFSRGREAHFPNLLKSFPELEQRLSGAREASEVRSLGPLEQPVRGTHVPGIVLLGDAAGYVDASTGEGLSLALGAVEQLIGYLPPDRWNGRVVMPRSYERARANLVRAYKLTTYGSLLLSRFPRLRRGFVHCLSRDPQLFQALLSVNIGSTSLLSFLPYYGPRLLLGSLFPR